MTSANVLAKSSSNARVRAKGYVYALADEVCDDVDLQDLAARLYGAKKRHRKQ